MGLINEKVFNLEIFLILIKLLIRKYYSYKLILFKKNMFL